MSSEFNESDHENDSFVTLLHCRENNENDAHGI